MDQDQTIATPESGLTVQRLPIIKRHTKPCKFFQTNQCPFEADDCNFAHIPLPEYTPPENTPARAKPCRFFAAGHCSEGLWCRFKHPADPMVPGSDGAQIEPTDIRDIDPALTRREMRKYPRRGTRNFSSIPQGRIVTTSPFVTFHQPVVQSNFAYSSGYPYHVPPPNSVSPATSSTTNESSDSPLAGVYTPSETSTDDVVMIMDDLQLKNESSYPFGGGSKVAGAAVTSATGHTLYPPAEPNFVDPTMVAYFPVVAAVPLSGYCTPILRAPTPLRRTRSRSKAMSKGKLASLKTKACKFYMAGGTCPEGDKCTFIHDEPIEPEGVKEHKEARKGRSGSVPSAIGNSQADLPRKPNSSTELERKRGFFPVGWRVIGGGVRVGGLPKSDGEQGRLTPEQDATYASEYHTGRASPAGDHPNGDRPKQASTKLPYLTLRTDLTPVMSATNDEEIAFPTLLDTGNSPKVQETAPRMGRVIPRRRSISDCTTSPVLQVAKRDALNLFSAAESPGVL